MRIDASEERAASLSCWSGPVNPEPLGGGMTNANFLVKDGSDLFVVRIGDDMPLHGIIRSHEAEVCKAAHASGVSPEIVHVEDGVLVMRYIEARTLSEADIREPETLERIAKMIRQAHDQMPKDLRGATLMFWVFHVCSKYLSAATQQTCRLKHLLADLSHKNDLLETRLGPIQMAFCHNDLLAANILDDGERLWLLDWEYAGWNTPLFDLANLGSNSRFDVDQREALFVAYFGKNPTAQEIQSVSAS